MEAAPVGAVHSTLKPLEFDVTLVIVGGPGGVMRRVDTEEASEEPATFCAVTVK